MGLVAVGAVESPSWLTRFWDWVDARLIVRRVVLGLTLVLTWMSYRWATGYAETSLFSGTDLALVISAVLAPVLALQGWAFKVYADGR